MCQDQQPYVIVEHHHQWLEATLNRPASLNALSQQMMHDLKAAIDQGHQNNNLTCIIIKATGKAFCAGHDIKQMQANAKQDYYQELFHQCSHLCNP